MNLDPRQASAEDVNRLHRQQFLITIGLCLVVVIGGWYLGPKIVGAANNTEALRDIQDANACRSELAADDSRALGQVVLVIAKGAEVGEDRAIYLERIRTAAAELERTQERRARTAEICAPDKE